MRSGCGQLWPVPMESVNASGPMLMHCLQRTRPLEGEPSDGCRARTFYDACKGRRESRQADALFDAGLSTLSLARSISTNNGWVRIPADCGGCSEGGAW